MSNTVLPKTPRQKKAQMMPVGDPRYNRYEDPETIRLREGTEDEHGMRRVEMTKGNPSDDLWRVRAYEKDGCKVEDKGFYWEISRTAEESKKARDAGHQEFLAMRKASLKKGQVKDEEDTFESFGGSAGTKSTKDLLSSDGPD